MRTTLLQRGKSPLEAGFGQQRQSCPEYKPAAVGGGVHEHIPLVRRLPTADQQAGPLRRKSKTPKDNPTFVLRQPKSLSP